MSWTYWPSATVYYTEAYVLFEDFLLEKKYAHLPCYFQYAYLTKEGEITLLLQLSNDRKHKK